MPEAGEAAGLERRNDERVIGGVVIEPARADDARVGKVGIGLDHRLNARQHRPLVGRDEFAAAAGDALVEVNVRPGPQLVRRWQRFCVFQGDIGQRAAERVLAFVELALLQHDECDPGPQLHAVGRRRRVAPGEILVVELDRGEIIGFVIGDPGMWVGPEDRAAFDADDVAGPEQRDILRHWRGQFDAAADRIAVYLQRDWNRRPRLDGLIAIARRDCVSYPLAQPRQERIGRERVHAAISNCGSTCSVPANSDLSATVRAR
jgi:hypothetical protein